MANKTDGMDKLKDSGQELLRNLGDKALDTVNDKLSGLTDKLTDIGNGGPIGKAAAKAGEATAKGDNPVMGGLKGAASGIKDKITGGGGGGAAAARPPSRPTSSRRSMSACPSRSPTTSGPSSGPSRAS